MNTVVVSIKHRKFSDSLSYYNLLSHIHEILINIHFTLCDCKNYVPVQICGFRAKIFYTYYSAVEILLPALQCISCRSTALFGPVPALNMPRAPGPAVAHHTQKIEVLLGLQAMVNGLTCTWHAAGTETTRAPLFSDCSVFFFLVI